MINRFYQDRSRDAGRFGYGRFGGRTIDGGCAKQRGFFGEEPRRFGCDMLGGRTIDDRCAKQREREETEAVYYPIEGGENPRTEFAVGKLDQIKEAGRPYEPANSPFVMLYFKAKGCDYHGLAKVAIPKHHEDISTTLMGYINEVKDELVDYMRQQNPDCEIRGSITVHGSNDNVVLNMMKKYVKARLEKIVKYELIRQN